MIFLTTAIFLRSHSPEQHIVQKIFCHIAEACVVAGCALSIFALQAKEIYLQGFNYYLQNLVKIFRFSSFRFEYFPLEKLSGEISLSMFVYFYSFGNSISNSLFINEQHQFCLC